MSRRCELTGKGVLTGNNVSHANTKTRRRFLPNLQARQLFSELLDIYKLDSGVLTPNLTEFPIAHFLKRIEATILDYAQKKDLSLRVVSNSSWVRRAPSLCRRASRAMPARAPC